MKMFGQRIDKKETQKKYEGKKSTNEGEPIKCTSRVKKVCKRFQK